MGGVLGQSESEMKFRAAGCCWLGFGGIGHSGCQAVKSHNTGWTVWSPPEAIKVPVDKAEMAAAHLVGCQSWRRARSRRSSKTKSKKARFA